MSNYPPGYEASSDPWQAKEAVEIPFYELRYQEHGDCGHCGKEGVYVHGMKYSYLVCKTCYDREPEYYDEE